MAVSGRNLVNAVSNHQSSKTPSDHFLSFFSKLQQIIISACDCAFGCYAKHQSHIKNGVLLAVD